MYIPQLRYPGQRIDHPDNEWASNVWRLLTSLETPLATAALALEWFEEAQSNRDTLLPFRELASGDLPSCYKHQVVFVHAHTFLYSLDRIDRTLQVLKEIFGSTYDISNIYKLFQNSVPDLRGVRNSSAHIEDRMRGLGRNGKPIIPNPLGVLIFECLHGTKFESTMADGNLGQVDMNVHTLKASETAIQSVIDLVKWTGRPQHWPS